MAGKSVRARDSGFSSLIDLIIQGRLRIPRDSVVFLDPETIAKVFTRKRAEVLKTIKRKKPKTIKALSRLLDRRVQAVDRDVKLLEKYELIKLERRGREAKPLIYKDAYVIILPSTSKSRFPKPAAFRHLSQETSTGDSATHYKSPKSAGIMAQKHL